MLQSKWRTLVVLGCAVLLLATLSACAGSEIAPTPVASTPIAHSPIAYSPLPTPTVAPLPTDEESLIYILPNGDVMLYTLADQHATTLLEGAYFFGDGELLGGNEIPLFHVIDFPLHPSPDGKWLLIPTPDQGTWLVAMDGSTQRQISPTILSATWAPDSRQITYTGGKVATANAPRMSILYTHNIVAGEEPHAIQKFEASIFTPVWSPGCDTALPPEGRSCGRHIFVFTRLNDDGNEPLQATVVDVETGQVKQLGAYKGPGRETAPFEFRWSPLGDEFWVPGPGFAGIGAIAFQLDGTTPRPLVAACDSNSNCMWGNRHGEIKTSGDWTIRYRPDSPNGEIYAQSPTGEQIEVATDAYFAGTLAQLRGNEVGQRTELVPLAEPGDPNLWNERILRDVGMRYRVPAQWDESGTEWENSVRNYRFTDQPGMVSLGSEQLTIHFTTEFKYDDAGEEFKRWLETHTGGAEILPDHPLPYTILNDYDVQVYQASGELMTIGDRPAVRLHSSLFPFAEKIVVPLRHSNLVISIWPRPSTQDPVLDKILASIVLPSPEGEASVFLHDTGLYDGPGLEYQRLDTLDIGDMIDVVARNETGDWLQLRSGLWVEASRVYGAPASLPVAPTPARPTPTPIAPSPLAPSPLATP